MKDNESDCDIRRKEEGWIKRGLMEQDKRASMESIMTTWDRERGKYWKWEGKGVVEMGDMK